MGPPAQAGVGVGSSSYSPINVQSDFGAHGNGIDDDTHALQAAFDEAFGTFDAPHYRDWSKNRPVYIPRGKYKISRPIRP
jgi:hypothetical protein